MEPNLMLKTSTVLFAIAALGGAAMAILRFSGKPHPPSWLAMVHGFLAAAALTLLVFAAFTASVPGVWLRWHSYCFWLRRQAVFYLTCDSI